MPVRNLTDRRDVVARSAILGVVRKGKKVDGDPVDLDHFRFVGRGPYKDELEQIWFENYGDEPRSLDFYLPYSAVEENWSTWREQWGKKLGLMHRCDGEFMVQWIDPETKKYHMDYDLVQRKPCPYCSGERDRTRKDPGCSLSGKLLMILEPFWQAGHTGYVILFSSSVHDLGKMTGELLDIETRALKAGRVGVMAGVGCTVSRVLEEVGTSYSYKGNSVKTKSKKWMLHVSASVDWSLQQLESQRQLALGVGRAPQPVDDMPALEFDNDIEQGYQIGDQDIVEGVVVENDVVESAIEELKEKPEAPKVEKSVIVEPGPSISIRSRLRKSAGWIPDKETKTWQRAGGDVVGRKKIGQQVAAVILSATKPVTDNPDAHHDVLNFLFSQQSTKALTVKEASVVLESWSGSDNPYVADQAGMLEIATIVEELRRAE